MIPSTDIHDRPVLTLGDLQAHDPRAPLGGHERRFLCPLPRCADHQRGSQDRSLSLKVESGLWTCHRCGAGGRLREHWTPRLGHVPSRASSRHASSMGTPRHPAATYRRDESSVALSEYAAGVALDDTPGADYLIGRGLGLDLAAGAGVRFKPNFYGRPAVLFPLRDRSRALVAVHGRYVDGRSGPKARTLGPKKLAAFATLGAFSADQLVVCEAPIDALSLAACGLPAIALCGTSGPDWLVLAGAFRDVLLGLDADEAGDRAAAELERELCSLGSRARRWRPVGAKDWNELLLRTGTDGILRTPCERGGR